jgi:hypothetical protein
MPGVGPGRNPVVCSGRNSLAPALISSTAMTPQPGGPAPSALEVALDPGVVRRILVLATGGVCLVGLVVELLRHGLELAHPALSLLSLSYEGNLPSWYASVLPLICCGLLAWIAAGETRDRGHWRVLACGFLAISIDEAISLHELLSTLFDTEGVLHFGWVIPAGALVVVLGLLFVGFLRRLEPPTARRFVAAGALYVTGAVLFELPLGWWTEHHGDDGPGYALIDWCEETLEFTGLTLFASALLARLHDRALRLTACRG